MSYSDCLIKVFTVLFHLHLSDIHGHLTKYLKPQFLSLILQIYIINHLSHIMNFFNVYYVKNKGAEQPAHLPGLIYTFVIHFRWRCIIYLTKKETHHLELINSQKDHKQWTSFVYIGSKVYQLLLHYTSFATRGKNVLKKNGHKPCGGQILKSHKKVFL